MNSPVKDYFRELNLSRQDSRNANYRKLQQELRKINNIQSQKAISKQMLINEALPIFESDEKYQKYLQQLDVERESAKNDIAREYEKKIKQLERDIELLHQTEGWNSVNVRKLEKEKQQLKDENKRLQIERGNQTQDFWGTLATVAGKAFDKWITSRQNQPSTPTSAPPSYALPVSLSGRWQGSDGLTYIIQHNGNQVDIQGVNLWNAIFIKAHGTLIGTRLTLQYFSTNGSQGTANLEVSMNGTQIGGNTIDQYGRSWPINLYR